MDQTVDRVPEILKLPFLWLCKFGFFSAKPLKRYLFTTIFGLLLIKLIAIAMIQFVNIKKDVSDFVRNLNDIFGYVQILGKLAVTAHNNCNFIKLFENIKLFWDCNGCNERIKTEINLVYRLILRSQKLFLLMAILSGAFIVLDSLFENTLPLGIWTLKNYDVLYYFVMIEEIIVLIFGIYLVWSLDCMYLGFCIEIVVQFRILSQHLEKLGDDVKSSDEMEKNYLNKMKICIQHHNLILGFIREFKQTFSFILLLQYVTIGPLICLELFLVFESHSYFIKAKHASAFMLLSLQLAFYCIPADYVASEALAISNAVYFSNWYSHYHPSLKIPILVMMQNAQAGIIIKAGGLVTMNTQTLVNELTAPLSTYSLAKGLEEVSDRLDNSTVITL